MGLSLERDATSNSESISLLKAKEIAQAAIQKVAEVYKKSLDHNLDVSIQIAEVPPESPVELDADSGGMVNDCRDRSSPLKRRGRRQKSVKP